MGIPIAAGTVAGLTIWESYSKYGLSADLAKDLAAKFLGRDSPSGSWTQQSIMYALTRGIGPTFAAYYILDRKVIPKLVSNKTLQKNTFGLVSA